MSPVQVGNGWDNDGIKCQACSNFTQPSTTRTQSEKPLRTIYKKALTKWSRRKGRRPRPKPDPEPRPFKQSQMTLIRCEPTQGQTAVTVLLCPVCALRLRNEIDEFLAGILPWEKD